MDCGKNRYEDKRAALSAMRRCLQRHGHGRPDDLEIYPCPRCRGWHLSSRKRPEKKRSRRERAERQARKHSRRQQLPARLMEEGQ